MSEDSSQTPSAAGEAPAKTSFSELLFFAFGLAIDGCIQNGLVGDIEEETTTGALMGAMAAHAPWCYAVWSEVESAMPYAWAHYRKRGGAGVSETLTGADFALLLRVGPQEFRAAVFQAKRSVNLDGGFKTVQISPAIGELPPQPQLVRLLEYAGTIEEKLQKNRKRPGWVHYLIYCHDEINFLCQRYRRIVMMSSPRTSWSALHRRLIGTKERASLV